MSAKFSQPGESRLAPALVSSLEPTPAGSDVRRGLFVAAMLLAGPALGHGYTAEENAWLNRQVALDGMKCCDSTDAHVSPDVEWRSPDGRTYEVRIRGAWMPVPPGRIMREVPGDPSPWGQAALLFHSPAGQVWCFRPEPLL